MSASFPPTVAERDPLDAFDVPVEPPPELWGLVVASTVHRPRLRRQLLHSLRAPLALAAVVLVVLFSATTAWVASRLTSRADGAAAAAPALAADAALDRRLAARDHEHGPIAPERVGALRAQLAGVDAALRHAPDDEALYRALAERERVLKEIRPVLGIGPPASRAPMP